MWVFSCQGQSLSVFVSAQAEEGIIKESLVYGCVPLVHLLGLLLIEDGRGRRAGVLLGTRVSLL